MRIKRENASEAKRMNWKSASSREEATFTRGQTDGLSRHLSLIFVFICVFLSVLGFFAKRMLIDEERFAFPLSVLFIVIFAVLLVFPVSKAVRKLWDRVTLISSASDRTVKENLFAFRTVIRLTGRLLLCWSPYLLIRFPGNADVDTYWQLMQVYGFLPLSDHHPIFDTLIFGLFWRLGDMVGNNGVSLFLYCGIQVFITALVLSFAHQYCLYRGISEKGGKAVFLFYALYPAVPLFAQTMAKDMLHGWIFVLFCILFYEMIYTRGACLQENLFFAGACLVVLAVMLTKKTGIYIAVISLVLSLFACSNCKKRLLLLLACPLLLFVGFYRAVEAVRQYERGSEAEMLSVPSQQVAYLVKIDSSELTDSDWAVLNSVYRDAEKLGDVYNPTRADATKGLWRREATPEQKKAFFVFYFKQLIERPYIMTMPVFALDYPLFCVDTKVLGNESLLYYLDEVPDAEEITYLDRLLSSWTENTSPEMIHRTIGSSYRTQFFSSLSSAFNECFFETANCCAVLFSKSLIVTWLPLFAVFYKISKSRFRGILMNVPLLLNFAVVAVGPIVLPRYLVNSVYILPLVMSSMFWDNCRVIRL